MSESHVFFIFAFFFPSSDSAATRGMDFKEPSQLGVVGSPSHRVNESVMSHFLRQHQEVSRARDFFRFSSQSEPMRV